MAYNYRTSKVKFEKSLNITPTKGQVGLYLALCTKCSENGISHNEHPYSKDEYAVAIDKLKKLLHDSGIDVETKSKSFYEKTNLADSTSVDTNKLADATSFTIDELVVALNNKLFEITETTRTKTIHYSRARKISDNYLALSAASNELSVCLTDTKRLGKLKLLKVIRNEQGFYASFEAIGSLNKVLKKEQ